MRWVTRELGGRGTEGTGEERTEERGERDYEWRGREESRHEAWRGEENRGGEEGGQDVAFRMSLSLFNWLVC